MRILVITDRYPPHYTGGYEIVCQSIIERLRERGHEVLVLTSNYGLRRTRIEGHIHRIFHRPQDSANLFHLARWEMADNRALRQRLKKWKPDVVSVWSMLQLFSSLHKVLRDLSIPVVFNLHDLWLPRQIAEGEKYRQAWLKSGSSFMKQLVKCIVQKTIQRQNPQWLLPVTIKDINLNNVIFCSRFRLEQHIAVGLPLGNPTVIYNGIDFTIFNGTPKPVDPIEFKVLFVGRLVKEKGAHTVIEAINHLLQQGMENITLTILGIPAYPWDYVNGLYESIERNGLQKQVKFLAPLANRELPELYSQYDALVFPSIGEEGFPITILEALACGLSVIGTQTGGTKEILEHEINSLTFPPQDYIALANCLRHLFEDQQFKYSLAGAGQSLMRSKFDIRQIVEQTESYLEKLVYN